jgi:hypothetical protein
MVPLKCVFALVLTVATAYHPMTTYRVAMLANKVSTTYVRVSNEHILPAQRQVVRLVWSRACNLILTVWKHQSQMLEFASSGTPEARTALMARLSVNQTQLQRQAQAHSKQVI